MEPQLMLRTSVILLALTGAGGVLMAIIRFSGRPHPPNFVTMAHGLLAGSGLTLLLYAGITHGLPGIAWGSLALLVAAALGGLILNLGFHGKSKPLPIGLMMVHAGVALVAVVVLTLAVGTLPTS
jgi:hypothetical protein